MTVLAGDLLNPVAETNVGARVRAVHVVPAIAHEASGPSYSVPRLCEALAAFGVEVELHVGDTSLPRPMSFPVHLHRTVGPFKRRLGISPAMRTALQTASQQCEIMHNHSLWMMPNIYPGSAVDGTDCRLIISPRGTLSPKALARSRFRKQVMWAVAQRHVLQRANCFHATAEQELADIRAAGFRQPVAVIPNCVDIPAEAADFKCDGPPRFLYFARIHPIKALDQLLSAWTEFERQVPDWELWIAGEGLPRHIEQIRQLSDELRHARVRFLGPKYGEEKIALYQAAHVYILPSHTENFGMTVAEALAVGLPAIVSKGAPWKGLHANRCGWWVDNDNGSLLSALIEASQTDMRDLREMGLRGRQWMRDEFSWERAGQMMADVYQWQIGELTRPAWVL